MEGRHSSVWPLLILPPWPALPIHLSSFWLGLGNALASSTAYQSCTGTGDSPHLPVLGREF